jgi:hypothetical protein|tara:strand:- start:275 stop:643 length:369 start_codon:yes stop_codon:yes gene_type:complete
LLFPFFVLAIAFYPCFFTRPLWKRGGQRSRHLPVTLADRFRVSDVYILDAERSVPDKQPDRREIECIIEVLLASVTLGELMMPVIMIQLIPLAMMVFVVRDPRQYDSSNHVLIPPIHTLPYD